MGTSGTVGAVTEPTEDLDEIAYLRDTDAATIIGNHIFVLLQVASLRLAATPPLLDEAQLLIDTVAAVVNTGADRLGEHVGLYRSAVAELQQAYVRATESSN